MSSLFASSKATAFSLPPNALMAMKPTSRGTVTIASKEPADDPLIDPNYFSTEVDKYVWRYSLRKIAVLMTGDTALGHEIKVETPRPGFEPLSVDASDEYLDSRVQAQGMSTYHGAGTCSMGAVVDSGLKVKGVEIYGSPMPRYFLSPSALISRPRQNRRPSSFLSLTAPDSSCVPSRQFGGH
ncbi:GMC oxidoreductase-domain-containing protein [Xylariaceae sp. FL0662B]|nr:GMC oxidoreductase-domain-containing protein [Xylariaceae sp. FL0662B]